MLEMDNQQATSWFTGILEGEGSFSLDSHNGCRVRISNTETDIIEKCSKFLTNRAILHNISSSQRGNKKREYEICVAGPTDCKNLYLHIDSHFDCRRRELEQILGASETTRDDSSDLWWLIGFLEAEGSFHISRRMSRNNEPNYSPEITVSNTRFLLIGKTVKTLYFHGMSWHISHHRPDNKNHSECKTVTIRGYMRVQRFLRVTSGMWQSSRIEKKASLVLEFCNSRLSMNIKEPYTARQHEIFHALRNMI